MSEFVICKIIVIKSSQLAMFKVQGVTQPLLLLVTQQQALKLRQQD